MKNMKILFAAFALLLFAGAAFASVNPKVQLLNYTLSETPAEPGHTLSVKLHMKSMEWDNCAERVSVQVSASYPLSVLGSDTQYLENLCFLDPDTKGDFTFKFPIDTLASSGTYQISIATTYEKRFTKLSESNVINVQVGGMPEMQASVVSSNPVDIYPGDTATVTVAFQNSGASMVQSSRATASSEGVVVKWASRQQEVGQVLSHGSATSAFTLEAPKNLRAGNYPFLVTLDYVAQNQSSGQTTFRFIVPVKAKADFAAEAAGSMLSGEKRAISIMLNNTGAAEAKNLKVRIKPLFPFSTDGTVRYVDSLPAGSAANLTYLVTVDKDATPGEQLLSLIVDFEDAQGKKFSDSADFAMNVRSPTLADSIAGLWYVWATIILAVAFFVMKGGKKKAAA